MGDRICVMKDGHIMQVADPTTLYDKPANAFVAGFIGMPEMNLVPADLAGQSGARTLSLDGQGISVGEELAARLQGENGPVTMGVRPQHLAVVAADAPDALTGTITNLEFMGHEVNLHADVGGATFVCVIPSDQFDKDLQRGDRVGLRPRTAKMHVFDATTGENISLG